MTRVNLICFCLQRNRIIKHEVKKLQKEAAKKWSVPQINILKKRIHVHLFCFTNCTGGSQWFLFWWWRKCKIFGKWHELFLPQLGICRSKLSHVRPVWCNITSCIMRLLTRGKFNWCRYYPSILTNLFRLIVHWLIVKNTIYTGM